MSAQYRTAPPPGALDQDLLALLADIETATIGHFESSGFITGGVRPVFSTRAMGRAITVAAPGRDGRVIYMAIDMIEPGDVLVISRIDHDDLACVGGGVTAAAKAKGAAAIIVDGPCTDPAEIVSNGLPVWCRGVAAKTTSRHTQLGGEVNFPISCGGTVVMPGYCVLADDSGIYVADPVRMREVAVRAKSRQQRSLAVRQHLLAGQSIFDFDRENSQ
ncbi:RraA family protein [Devosia sp. ZW T5_3]|jgi:4-hydroxy-4-methyl-2-oxoglutarate aldolase|uniref:RraA family protein n=1 Tax=Devosia sp. ZW T5_3 TaxID=3378085 RepID=UPI000DDFF140